MGENETLRFIWFYTVHNIACVMLKQQFFEIELILKTFKTKKWSFLKGSLISFSLICIQFNLLLSPYPCFISLLYLDLYVLGDDALIS